MTEPIAVVRELARLLVGRSRHTLPALIVVALEKLSNNFSGRKHELVAVGKLLQSELEEILGPRGVLLFPPYSRPAPRHDMPLLTPFDFVCTGLFNVLEFPSTTLPVLWHRGPPGRRAGHRPPRQRRPDDRRRHRDRAGLRRLAARQPAATAA